MYQLNAKHLSIAYNVSVASVRAQKGWFFTIAWKWFNFVSSLNMDHRFSEFHLFVMVWQQHIRPRRIYSIFVKKSFHECNSNCNYCCIDFFFRSNGWRHTMASVLICKPKHRNITTQTGYFHIRIRCARINCHSKNDGNFKVVDANTHVSSHAFVSHHINLRVRCTPYTPYMWQILPFCVAFNFASNTYLCKSTESRRAHLTWILHVCLENIVFQFSFNVNLYLGR